MSLCVQKWELNLLKDFEKCNDIQVVQILNYKENQLSKLQKTLNYQKQFSKLSTFSHVELTSAAAD